MSLLSNGPFSHNRFSAIDEFYAREKLYFTEKKKASKDYDGDGEVESSSKEHAGVVHNAIQKKKGGVPDGKDTRKDVKESSCSPGCSCDDCKKSKKKKMYEWIEELVQEGYDLSEYTMEDMEEAYDKMIAEEAEEEVSIGDAIVEYLIENGFANNWVSAEIVMKNMSEEWLNQVANELQEGYGKKKEEGLTP